MRIVASALWHRDAVPVREGAVGHTEDIPPQAGQTHAVWMPGYEVVAGAALQLLWCPVFSEDNGWESRPSDILMSQIVTGPVRVAQGSVPAPIPAAGTGEVRCEVRVDSRVPLLDGLESLALTDEAWPRPSRGAFEIWQHAGWCGTADVANFTYLSAVCGEAQLELLLRRRGEGWVAHYEHYWVDGWSESAIGAWPLKGSMLSVCEKLLGQAQLLIDQA